jgi:hypothetical protein
MASSALIIRVAAPIAAGVEGQGPALPKGGREPEAGTAGTLLLWRARGRKSSLYFLALCCFAGGILSLRASNYAKVESRFKYKGYVAIFRWF